MAQQALITGAARRIGKSLALGLADNGWDIALHYYRSDAAAHEVRAEIVQKGRRCELFQADLSDSAQVIPLFAAVRTAFPDLALIINSASLFSADTIHSAGPGDMQAAFTIHLFSPLRLIQEFTRTAGSGLVINIIDTNIVYNDISRFSYSLSKKALAEMTRMAALACAPGFRVNGIAPGAVLPPGDNPEIPLDPIRANPMKTIVSLEGLLNTVLFLIRNRDITGQIISVDGGQNLRQPCPPGSG
ncbi:SDR family oxidoreductase [bacterium]|nr:SDR family oxidoreductase [bacterium]